MTKTMWAVGPEDDSGWEAIDAPTELDAKVAWMGYILGPNDKMPSHIIAQRVEAWDGLEKISGPDWLNAGLGYTCEQCDELAFNDGGGGVIDGEVLCEDCALKARQCELCEGDGEIMQAVLLPSGHSEQMGPCPDCDGEGTV